MPVLTIPTDLLDRSRIVARPGFNRWLVPPAALAIHLSIGMAYGFSVFWLPLSQAVGFTTHVPCPEETGFWTQVVATTCDWKVSWLNVMYTLFFVFLGSSAAVFGRWLEQAGPRKAGGSSISWRCCAVPSGTGGRRKGGGRRGGHHRPRTATG
jgi:hypothetical protein